MQVKEGEVPVRIQTKVVPRLRPGRPKSSAIETSEYHDLIYTHQGDVDEAFIEKTSELFGDWQIEPYQPGRVENDKIPVNRFGNVYMFRPNMAPIGSVYLTSSYT